MLPPVVYLSLLKTELEYIYLVHCLCEIKHLNISLFGIITAV